MSLTILSCVILFFIISVLNCIKYLPFLLVVIGGNSRYNAQLTQTCSKMQDKVSEFDMVKDKLNGQE
jgi:hypothetical protein